MDDEKVAEDFYRLIYDYLEINPMRVDMMIIVFEKIKFEQLLALKNDVHEGE